MEESDFQGELKRRFWDLSESEVDTLIRLASAATDERNLDTALLSFSDPAEVAKLGAATWAKIEGEGVEDESATKDGELARMLKAAEDDQLELLQGIAVNAGLLWKCHCGHYNDEDEPKCRECGKPSGPGPHRVSHLRRFLRQTRHIEGGRITQEDIATAVGCTQPAVNTWVNGGRPSPEHARKLAAYFHGWTEKHGDHLYVPTFEDLLFPFGLPGEGT